MIQKSGSTAPAHVTVLTTTALISVRRHLVPLTAS